MGIIENNAWIMKVIIIYLHTLYRKSNKNTLATYNKLFQVRRSGGKNRQTMAQSKHGNWKFVSTEIILSPKRRMAIA